MRSRTRTSIALATALAVGMALLSGAARAAVFVVTKTNDSADGTCDADCSLREAVIAANAAATADTIQLGPGTYTLSIAGATGVDDEDAIVGDLDILTSFGGLSIEGAGAAVTTIDASAINHRHFHVPENFSAVSVSISGVTLVGGNVSGLPFSGIPRASSILARSRFVTGVSLVDSVVRDNGADAAIVATAPLTVTRCMIRDNAGTGIHLTTNAETQGTSKASTIQDSAIVANHGPALTDVRAASNKSHTFTIVDSTLSGNDRTITPTSTLGAVFTTANGVLRNVTIANDGGRGISAIYDFYGTPTLQVQNSIVSGNARGNVLGIGQDDAAVLPVSLGNNVIGDGGAGAFTQATDRINTNPLLSALADHGGPTVTHDLGAASLAVDRGNPAACDAADQRGFARPVDGNGDGIAVCDIGSVELVPPACANGVDDDGDETVDGGDPGCSGVGDDSERGSDVCDDGLDNDEDGLADKPDDPGCRWPFATYEDPPCDDGLDNDGNQLTDFEDPKCSLDWPYWEVWPCGLGAELALLLPAVAALRRRLAGPRG